MSVKLPGTTIEVSAVTKGISRTLFGGIFAAGGITLSQVSVMTGLEPYDVQNWSNAALYPRRSAGCIQRISLRGYA